MGHEKLEMLDVSHSLVLPELIEKQFKDLNLVLKSAHNNLGWDPPKKNPSPPRALSHTRRVVFRVGGSADVRRAARRGGRLRLRTPGHAAADRSAKKGWGVATPDFHGHLAVTRVARAAKF